MAAISPLLAALISGCGTKVARPGGTAAASPSPSVWTACPR